jgi:hypothetical protein
VLVEPAFNQFTPLPDGPLRSQILQLAADEHVHLDDVLVADASRRTTTLNAYVSGYGSTRRVVLYDTVVNCPECNAVAATSTPTATPLEGGVEAETNVPTAPRTDVLDSSGTATPGTNFGLVLVIIGLLAFAVLFVTPAPASAKDKSRRR